MVAGARLSPRFIEAVKRAERPAKDQFYWDRHLKGYGLKVTPRGRLVFVVQARYFGKTKRYTIGTHPPLTEPDARAAANRTLAKRQLFRQALKERGYYGSQL